MQKIKWALFLALFPILLAQAAFGATAHNPLLVENDLYVSYNGIHKFNQASLEQAWSSLQGIQTFEPVMGERLLYVGTPQGLYALNPDNGEIVWRIEETQTIFSPVVGEYLYAGSLHGTLYSIAPGSGDIKWRAQFDGWIYSPAVLPDQDQLWTGGQAHQAFAIAIEDGRQLHALPIGQESIFSPQNIGRQQVAFNLFNGNTAIINTQTASVAGYLEGTTQPKNLDFDENLIYRSGRDGGLTAFDRNSYQQQWQKPMVGHDLTMHPGNEGYLLLSDLDKNLIIFSQLKGIEIWREQLTGKWFSPIQIDDKSIIYFQPSILQPNAISAVKIDAKPTY
ncbi:MAG: PQQ-binding-like beta-propeller repeat protein [Gammaproteobacteria bacterium]|nr:PQQ-binding-like beta-propeller repeat protein [Gammaproteobacteria bacterium]